MGHLQAITHVEELSTLARLLQTEGHHDPASVAQSAPRAACTEDGARRAAAAPSPRGRERTWRRGPSAPAARLLHDPPGCGVGGGGAGRGLAAGK